MKELTIEQKAQRYDEAIKKAKEWFNAEEPDSYTCIIESIFPELKESEDERIRKELIDFVKSRLAGFPQCEKFISWLEKQGEQKRFRDFIQIGDKVTRNEAGILVNLSQLERIAKPRKVKPTKPKFHVGEWITDGNITIQIEAIKNDCYLYCGDCTLYSTKTADKVYHLWTIQDAKDGDILIYNNSIFIYNEIYEKHLIYYGIYEHNKFHDDKYFSFIDTIDVNNIHPATKEQCETLMRAMSDAGYTFDFEKKELIEESKNIKNQIMSEITDLVKDYITQKPAEWSEEDEKRIINILELLNVQVCWGEKEMNPYQKEIDWLKSLKYRVRPKVEWSEEDEEYSSYICAALDCYYRLREDRNNTNGQENLDKAINWLHDKLKFLRPQKQWKPSDEQLEALESATENCAYSEYQDCLRELLNQLKKLREE